MKEYIVSGTMLSKKFESKKENQILKTQLETNSGQSN
jgi:hypothetical protein